MHGRLVMYFILRVFSVSLNIISQAFITDLRTLEAHIISYPFLYLEPSLLSSFNDSLRILVITCLPWVLYVRFLISARTENAVFSLSFSYSNWRCEVIEMKNVLPRPLMNLQYVFRCCFPTSLFLCLSQTVAVSVCGRGKASFSMAHHSL